MASTSPSHGLALLIFLAGCSAPDPAPQDASTADAPDAAQRARPLTVVSTGRTATVAIDAEAGGNIELAGASRTFVLEITPGALAADTEITLEEVTVPELPGAMALRFAPDGLVFSVPALLSVDAPYDEPMLALAFRAGEPGIEMEFAAPHEGGLSMQIAHFSEAALAPADEASAALDEEQRADAMDADTFRSKAFGLGAILRGRITSLVEAADDRVSEMRIAGDELSRIEAQVELATLEDANASPFGPPTLRELVDELLETFRARALALHERLTEPRCVANDEIVGVRDWAIVVNDLRAVMMRLAIPFPATARCVHTRLSVASSPDRLSPSVDAVTLTRVVLELVGPGDTPEVALAGESLFTFVATGASGATDRLSLSGELSDVVFARPAEPRPPEVTIVVNGHSADTMLGALPRPEPITVRVAEPRVFAGAISLSTSCTNITAPRTIECPGRTLFGPDIITDSYLLDGGLRVTLAGDLITVEAGEIAATRNHVVITGEDVTLGIDHVLTAAPVATTVPMPGVGVRVRLCGPGAETTRTEEICSGDATESTAMLELCVELVLTPTPATDPTEIVPSAVLLGCADETTSVSGVLVPE
jgi:hypothetical protein